MILTRLNISQWGTVFAFPIFLASCSAPQPALQVPEVFKKGQKIFHRACSNCHNSDALGGLTKAPKLIDAEFLPTPFPDEDIKDTILNGSQSGKMPSQKSKVSSEEIPEVIKYLRYSQKAAGLSEDEEEKEEDMDAELSDDAFEDENVAPSKSPAKS